MAFPIPIIDGVLKLGSSIIERLWPDPAQQADAKLKLLAMQHSGELQELVSAAGIIQAEAQSVHWLTANWRPLTMMTFVTIIANNFIIYPYLSLFWGEAPRLEIPPDMWDLLKIGIGGYVAGRSGEKMIDLWRSKSDTK